jgi:hypothetical protein
LLALLLPRFRALLPLLLVLLLLLLSTFIM